MNDFDRLHESSPSPRLRALLAAGQSDSPPAGFAERLMLGVGIAGGTAGATTAASAATTAVKVAALTQGTVASGATAPSAVLVVAKWVVLGALGGGFLAAGANLALSPNAVSRATPTEVTRVATASLPTPALEAAATPLAAVTSAAAPPSESPSAPKAVATPSVSASSGQLGREVELIDRVRRAIAAGDAQLALAELDAHSKITKSGVLDREARVLRIQALYLAGDTARAEQLSARYLAEFPNDALAARLRASARGAPK